MRSRYNSARRGAVSPNGCRSSVRPNTTARAHRPRPCPSTDEAGETFG